MRGSIIKRGTKYTVVIYLGRDENGKKKQKWYSGFRTQREAQKELNRILGEIESGSFIIPSKQPLKDYLDNWLTDYCELNLKAKTVDGYRSYIKNHISRVIGHVLLEDLKPFQVQSFYDDLHRNGRHDGKGGLSGKTIQQIHRILSKALKRAQRLQLIKQNPCDYVERPKVETFRPSVYTKEQVQKLLTVAKQEEIYIPVLLAAVLGMRRGEILGLTWDKVDFENKVISVDQTLYYTSGNQTVGFSTPKTESGKRRLLIADSLCDILVAHKEEQDKIKNDLKRDYQDWNLVCCYANGRYFHPARFSHKFKRLLEIYDLKHIRFHDLRHTNATMMLEGNIPAKIASQRLGHSSIQVTLDIYSHVRDDAQKGTVELIDGLLN